MGGEGGVGAASRFLGRGPRRRGRRRLPPRGGGRPRLPGAPPTAATAKPRRLSRSGGAARARRAPAATTANSCTRRAEAPDAQRLDVLAADARHCRVVGPQRGPRDGVKASSAIATGREARATSCMNALMSGSRRLCSAPALARGGATAAASAAFRGAAAEAAVATAVAGTAAPTGAVGRVAVAAEAGIGVGIGIGVGRQRLGRLDRRRGRCGGRGHGGVGLRGAARRRAAGGRGRRRWSRRPPGDARCGGLFGPCASGWATVLRPPTEMPEKTLSDSGFSQVTQSCLLPRRPMLLRMPEMLETARPAFWTDRPVAASAPLRRASARGRRRPRRRGRHRARHHARRSGSPPRAPARWRAAAGSRPRSAA